MYMFSGQIHTSTNSGFISMLLLLTAATEIEKGAYDCNEHIIEQSSSNSIWHFNLNSLQGKKSTSQWSVMENK